MSSAPAVAVELLVPSSYPTIQAAIDAAGPSDVVRVAPGVYAESLAVTGKRVELVSEFVFSGNPADIDSTIIDGGGAASVILVQSTPATEFVIRGFTIRNGVDGIAAFSRVEFRNGVILQTMDAIDLESGSNGSLVADSLIHLNLDDAVDLDGDVGATIERNQLVDNGDDGIEVRLHDFSGPRVDIVIRDNLIEGNGEDGIQLIDGQLLSPRYFLIEGNIFHNNAFVGLGMMANMNTIEDFSGAPIAETIHLFNNTFVGNDHAVTGGVNLVAVNNLFEGQTTLAVKNVTGQSTVAHSLFFNNVADESNSNVDAGTTLSADPLLDPAFVPQTGSPAIDTGTAQFTWNSEVVLDVAPSEYVGSAPDLGAIEVPEPSLVRLVSAGLLSIALARRRTHSAAVRGTGSQIAAGAPSWLQSGPLR